MNFSNCQLDVAAGPSEVMTRAARIRYATFVDELKYEPKGRLAGREQTRDDAHSLHFVFCDKSAPVGEQDIGCVRLILPVREPNFKLPCQKAYQKHIIMRPSLFNRMAVLPRNLSETSRLTIAPHYRQRTGMRHLAVFDALVMGAVYVGTQLGMRNSLIMAQPRMAKHLQHSLGLEVEALAPPIEHHGPRAAYQVSAVKTRQGLTRQAQALFEWTSAQLSPALGMLRNAGMVQLMESRQAWRSRYPEIGPLQRQFII